MCGSQAHDTRDTVLSNRNNSSRLDRYTAPDPKSRPDVPLEQAVSVKSSSGGHTSSGASFCEEIRNRTRRMQQEMKKREDSIASLHLQIQHLQDKNRYSFWQSSVPLATDPLGTVLWCKLRSSWFFVHVWSRTTSSVALQRCDSAAGAATLRCVSIPKSRVGFGSAEALGPHRQAPI